MASWSPSQSLPLTVSYMCQRQSSGVVVVSAVEDQLDGGGIYLRSCFLELRLSLLELLLCEILLGTRFCQLAILFHFDIRT